MAELLERVSSRELSEWQAFDRLEPVGETRLVYQLALLAAMMGNALRGKGEKARGVEEFVLRFGEQGEERQEMTAEQSARWFAMLTGAELTGADL